MSYSLYIRLFGSLQVQHGSQTIRHFRTQPMGALLAYLAYHLDRPHSREQLAERFWPDRTPEASHNSLRQALYSLRKQLEPEQERGEILIADHWHVQLNPRRVETDVREFQRLAAQAGRTEEPAKRLQLLTHLNALYTGELLADRYEEWIFGEQQALLQTELNMTHELINALAAAGDLPRAIELALNETRLHPDEESFYRDAIRLYHSAGNEPAAQRLSDRANRLFGAPPALSSELPFQGIVALLATERRADEGILTQTIHRHNGAMIYHEGRFLLAAFPHSSSAAECAVQLVSGPASKATLDASEIDQRLVPIDTVIQAQRELLGTAHPGQIVCTQPIAYLLSKHPARAKLTELQ